MGFSWKISTLYQKISMLYAMRSSWYSPQWTGHCHCYHVVALVNLEGLLYKFSQFFPIFQQMVAQNSFCGRSLADQATPAWSILKSFQRVKSKTSFIFMLGYSSPSQPWSSNFSTSCLIKKWMRYEYLMPTFSTVRVWSLSCSISRAPLPNPRYSNYIIWNPSSF